MGVEFKIDTNGLRKVRDEATTALLRRAQSRILATAKVTSPVDTGAMRAAHKPSNIRLTAQGGTADIESVQTYSMFVHEGTKAHTIVPKRASVLSFTIGGRRVFAKSVNHPGTKAQPWLRRALETEGGRLGFVVTD